MRQIISRIALPCAVLLCASGPALLGDEYNKRTDVTINNPVEVPGAVLQPGTYEFRLVDSPSDRHIVEISSEDGKTVFAVVFTAAAERVQRTANPVMTFYEGTNGRPSAVDKWFWPGELDGQQFLYPHKQAQIISQATGKNVPEAPEEQNEPGVVSQNQAPQTQNAPKVRQAEPAPAPARPNIARAAEPPAQPREVAQATPPPAPQPQPVPAPGEQPEQLPQTASDLPLVGLIGLLSIFAAFALRLRQRAKAMR